MVYTGKGTQREQGAPIERISLDHMTDPRDYRAGSELAQAVEVSILLGQPLLLTGLPGTGKTQLAHSVAWEILGEEKALTFVTKSTSVSRELFYSYDSLGRFQSNYNPDASKDPLHYIRYNALGAAILRANPSETYRALLPPDFHHPGMARQSVVLIDEIDKAPRDFPNDLLNEIEAMSFRIPELRNEEVRAPQELRPIVIITSNSEKNLPDAFLRRCVYHHIPPPSRGDLLDIINLRVGRFKDTETVGLDDALTLFLRLRADDSDLTKKPATAELIAWLAALRFAEVDFRQPLKANPAALKSTLGVLVKLHDDLAIARKHLGIE